jgi:hypothetical protein
MTEKTVINIDDVPLADRGNGKQFAVKWGRVGPLVGLSTVWVARCTSFRRARRRFPSTVITCRMSCFSSFPARANIGSARRSSESAAATSLPRRPAATFRRARAASASTIWHVSGTMSPFRARAYFSNHLRCPIRPPNRALAPVSVPAPFGDMRVPRSSAGRKPRPADIAQNSGGR